MRYLHLVGWLAGVSCRAARAGTLAAAFLLAGCERGGSPPSVVLAVLDTTRADAVSAYGHVAGTTPTCDALAKAGVLYERAYANANWTIPSHATLFTGLLPSQHGVPGRTNKLLGMPTLAEKLSQAGYETVAFNENPSLTDQSLRRGFEHFTNVGHDMPGKVQQWLAQRDRTRPFFLFLNIMDSHSPYLVRDSNPFLDADVSPDEARSVARDLTGYRCAVTPGDRIARILHGLYLGNVRAADAKLGAVLAMFSSLDRAPIVIATSDHGEHFGEHGLIEHEVGVDHAVTHVPLIVRGLSGVAGVRIHAPVQLADILPTVLGWAGVVPPADASGRPLPTTEPPATAARAIVAEFPDYRTERFYAKLPAATVESMHYAWRHCGADDRVAGDMRAVIGWPYELLWYERYPPQLFDLRAPLADQPDLAGTEPKLVAELQGHLQEVLTLARQPANRVEFDAAQLERMRALGYLGSERSDTRREDAAP